MILPRMNFRLRELVRLARNRLYVNKDSEQEIVDTFHMLYYEGMAFGKTWGATTWLGVHTAKTPLDLWVYQEIIYETKPDIIIETGTANGGSALYMACINDLIDGGKVISIDISPKDNLPHHPRVTYLTGSSTSPEITMRVNHLAQGANRIMVVLDSDHSKAHVRRELELFAPLVTVGCYLIVEDTNVNGHPVWPDHGPGPMEALSEFLEGNGAFEIDHGREKFYLTFNPSGYLLRTKGVQLK